MKRSKIVLILLCFLILFSGTASAKQLTVKKVTNTDIKTGDSVNITLEFENPFNKSIPIKIQDNNILGNNGLEIQCYEYTLPNNPHTGVSYDFPIQAYSAGEFTLDPATVTYTNPETGTEESVTSGPVRVSIKQGGTTGQQQGITRIYNCGGVSMQSTSISSSSSTSISISSGSQQAGQQAGQNNNQQPANSPENIQQSAQDMQNIKQEMERQKQEQQKMENELKERIENNSDFQKLNEELQKQGYAPADREVKPESNDTGNFNYQYKKGEESANISGRMNAGNMENITKQSTEDIKKLEQYIESNETFMKMNKTLSDKGYNLTGKNIDLKTNISSFEYSYGDKQGKNASITGNVTDTGEIKDISLKEPQAPFPYWILAALLMPLLGIYLYSKFRNNAKPVEPVKEIIYIDPKKNALLMLEKAVEMFNNGMQREAYLEASHAVRSYFKGTSGINELTSDEIITGIRGSKDEGYVRDARECFMLCDLVKFAKYEPNAEDFNRVIEYARRIIV
ncbi:hypothetical protein METP2_00702 [Methanosarcinales archaeon]|nr:BatD family protein [Candidatus Methanoperedens sp.]CAG0959540.1 hypothetical protein METP2_00702 [Methanosarcinales archaeon]